MQKKRLGQHLLNPQFLVLSFALISITLLMSLITYKSLKEQLKQSLQDQAEVIAQNIGPALQFEDVNAAQSILDSLKNNAAIKKASLLNAEQQIFVTWMAVDAQPLQDADTLIQPIEINGILIGKIQLNIGYAEVNKRVLTNLFATIIAVIIALVAGFAILQKVQLALKKSQEQLYLQANFDALTLLPNRYAFLADLSEKLSETPLQTQLHLYILDLDNFKMINDTHGHNMGDKLLIAVSQRLKSCLPKHWQLYRLGSDEFVILSAVSKQLPNPLQQAENFLNAMQSPFNLSPYEFFVQISIGISQAPKDGDNVETLLRCADTALHEIKSQHKGHAKLYTVEMMTAIQHKLNTETALRHAIEQQEFVLHYQPQISLATRKITGVEALIRWKTSTGLISPDNFIPQAEEAGLILSIGEWALTEGARVRKAWLDEGITDLVMAINLSGHQLTRQNLPRMVEKVLKDTQLPPQLLELEITESMLMQDLERVVLDLQKIRQMGVHIAIDDFGTGYSSIAYLKQLPIDVLKIDRSFVKDLDHDENDRSIIKAILQLSKNLGLTPLAEGVESQTHEDFLKQHGCSRAQGYLYSKPLPEVETLALIAHHLEENENLNVLKT